MAEQVNLHDALHGMLTEAGVLEIKFNYERPKADRFVYDAAEIAQYKEAITLFLESLAETGIEARDVMIEMGESAAVRWERDRRFTDKHVVSLPMMPSTYSSDPRNDMPFSGIVERFRVGADIALTIAVGMKNPKLGSFSVSFTFDQTGDPRRAWAEAASLKEVSKFWFDQVDAQGDARVDFNSSWGTDYRYDVRDYDPSKPPEVRLNASIGPRATFLESRLAHVRAYYETLSAMRAPFDEFKPLGFEMRAGGTGDLGMWPIEELARVGDVVDAVAAIVKGLEFGSSGKREAMVRFADTLRVSMDVSDYSGRVDISLPTFHETRVREAKNIDDFLAQAQKDVEHLKLILDWKDELGALRDITFGYQHDSLSLSTEHLQALLSTLTPHLKAIPMDNTRRSLSVNILPDNQPAQMDAYGRIQIPISPSADPEGIGAAVEAFFAKNKAE